MQPKYDRNIEDFERARMEEGRYWNPRYTENPQGQYGFQSGFGQIDPTWLMQQRIFQQLPYQQIPGFYGQLPQYGMNPMIPVPQQHLYSQNIPQQYPFIPQQLGFGSFSHPFQQQSQFPVNPLAGFGFPNQPINPAQQFPFQPFGQQMAGQIPTGSLFQEQPPGEHQRELWGLRHRLASRVFQRAPRNYRRPDEMIRDEICKKLALTPEVDATDVEVIVRDGEVTLRGNVDDRYEKRLVEDIIETTFGVRDLLNEIRVGSRQEQELTGTPTKSKEK